jgi:FixJ family two-component response regulator
VLVVDDDPSVLPALARLIRAIGLTVETFDRPSALLASKMPKSNACMLIDLYLPEMNGIELCNALAESGCDLPAIIITGRGDAETLRMLEHASSVATLAKPVDEQVLLEAITRALELSRGGRTKG